MNKSRIYPFLLSFVVLTTLSAQNRRVTLDLVQQDKLEASMEQAVKTDGGYLLGSTLTVTGGAPAYTYLWSPSTYLDSPIAANPTASSDAVSAYLVTVKDSRECSCTASVTLNTTGTAAHAIEKLSVYPNPATDQLVVRMAKELTDSEQLTIKLYDLTGLLMRTEVVNQAASTTYLINVSSYPRGICFLQLSINGRTETQLIVLN